MTQEPDPRDRRTGRAAVAALGAVALVLLGSLAFIMLQIRAPADRFAACRQVKVGGGMKLGAPFELTDQNGIRVTDAEVVDRPALIYFGYTFCPDVCPLDVARNADAVDLLAEKGYEVRPVFITVDPARDTPEVLADYAEAMHPRMIALTGGEEELARLRTAFRVVAAKQEGDDPEYYLMSHTTLSYLMLPGQGVVALFSRQLSSADMAEKTACYLDHA